MKKLFNNTKIWLLGTELTPRQRVEQLGLRLPAALILVVFTYLNLTSLALGRSIATQGQLGLVVQLGGSIFGLILIFMINKGLIYPARWAFVIGIYILLVISCISVGDITRTTGVTLLFIMLAMFAAILFELKHYLGIQTVALFTIFMYQLAQSSLSSSVFVLAQFSSVSLVLVSVNYLFSVLRKNLDELDNLNQSQLDLLSSLADQERSSTEQKEQLSLIIENVADGLIVLNQKKEIYIINEVALGLLKQKRNEVIGKSYEQYLVFYDDRQQEQQVELVEELYDKGKVFSSTHHISLKIAEEVFLPVGVSASPLKNKRNEVTSSVLVLRDETDERRQDQMKSDFVSVASHQLRTPLTAIKWNVDLLKDLVVLDDTSKQVLKDIKDSTERMISLVGSLLDLSRIERNVKIDMNLSKFNFIELINDSIKENKVMAKANEINFNLEAPQEFILEADKNKIFQVVNNLISNAVKYSHPHATVQIKFRQTPSQIMLEVIDQGIGIPEHQQKKIFKKFFRADNAIKHKAEGNGIGLYLAKSYIEAHNGLLTFISIEGKGTSFVITLPYVDTKKAVLTENQ